ncbi:MAG: hypothetical protein ACPHO4_01795 [Longimicrobiales bacterium]
MAALALLLAQLGASAALPVADALLESRGVAESVHVENTETDCATHHDDRYCQVIRSLSGQRRASGVAAPSQALAAVDTAPPVRSPISGRRAGLLGPIGPRAPPLG